jgi:putative DNA methylase
MKKKMEKSNNEDRRLIEDYLPIKAISKEASREKSVRKGHISTLHLWWARRPLVACRAAVYGALVPEDRFRPKNGPPEKRNSLGRANAAKFLKRLCKYPGNPQVIKEAGCHILEAHAERLTRETGEKVTLEDIEQGRAPRPKVLDMFAGGGAIPLEALRLGCEAYALDLNPVAHIIELCTLVYPQKYGKPDPSVKGMTGPKNKKGEKTWGGLADEVRYWGEWVLERVREEIGDLYPPIPDPEYKGKRPEIEFKKGHWAEKGKSNNILEESMGPPKGHPRGYLIPVAYLWTRTVKCKNPSCGATVPLVRQTWLRKKKGSYVALKATTHRDSKCVHFQDVEASSEKELGFDPSIGSKGGNATCPFCGTVAESSYVKEEGRAKRIGEQLMAVVCRRSDEKGKVYIAANDLSDFIPDIERIHDRILELCAQTGLTEPNEPTPDHIIGGGGNCQTYGLLRWKDLFTLRQMFFLLSFVDGIRFGLKKILSYGCDERMAKAVISYLGLLQSTVSNSNSTICRWIPQNQQMGSTFSRNALPMTWDFAEINPFGGGSGDTMHYFMRMLVAIQAGAEIHNSGHVERGSATKLDYPIDIFDAIITDPPYYDNLGYALLSDFFYVWLKRAVGDLFREHFASALTPKKNEIVADAFRYGRDIEKSKRAYESMMTESFREANRVLKPDGQMVVIYAHKTTLGWSSLVNALQNTGFSVTEAWPLKTEKPGRPIAYESSALVSSIFLIARKRHGGGTGSYEDDVRPELRQIVGQRLETLWEIGITGADLVIAAVGAGLRAFTRFERVEYANGEQVPAERFLSEVETVVLETILKQLSKQVVANSGKFSLAGIDSATRFYILWRYTYKYSVLDAGEAIVFANGTHVELDGPNGLSSGDRALLEKKKGKYTLKDYTDRGSDKKLGQMMEDGQAAPMIDALHRTLWLMENRPGELPAFLQEAQPNREQMRLVAQALAGPALKGGELGDISPHAELSALAKLTANWKSVIEGAALTLEEKKEQKTGQRSLFK